MKIGKYENEHTSINNIHHDVFMLETLEQSRKLNKVKTIKGRMDTKFFYLAQ